MAALLSMAMTAIIWLAVMVGVFAFAILGIGLFTSLNGGNLDLGGLSASGEIGPGTFLITMAAVAVIMPGVVYVCLQLRRILSTLAEGDPFVPENAPRLTRIAIALGGMEIAGMTLAVLVGDVLDRDGGPGEHQFSINLTLWAAVITLLVLSQVFREGTRLREEEKMTI